MFAGAFNDALCANATWSLSFQKSGANAATFNAHIYGTQFDNVYVAFDSPSEEAVFGLGEQAGLGNLRGTYGDVPNTRFID